MIIREPDNRRGLPGVTALTFALTAFRAASTAIAQDAVAPKSDTTATTYNPFAWIRDLMPESLRQSVLFIENWQWLALLALILVGGLFDRLTVVAVKAIINAVLRRKKTTEAPAEGALSPDIWRNSERPFGIVAWSGFVLLCLPLLMLPEGVHATLSLAASVVFAAGGIWAAYRVVDVLSVFLARIASGTSNKIDDMLVPLVRRTAKVFVIAIGIVFVAQNMGIEVGSLLAGLGIGGLAFALAAKDLVANFFGSITVLFDQPFQIGDWVVIGNAEGNVEKVGFRSTRIRTFYNSVITLPNSKLIDTIVDNLGMRKYRRYKSTFGIAFDTAPLKIEAFCEALRELVRIHPYTRKDYYLIYFNDLAESSLSIMIYIFHQCPDWATELRERHRFLVDSLGVADSLGVEFAFPTRTVHLKGSVPQTPTPVPEPVGGTSRFEPENLEEALENGRATARNVASQTLKDGEIPTPVSFLS